MPVPRRTLSLAAAAIVLVTSGCTADAGPLRSAADYGPVRPATARPKPEPAGTAAPRVSKAQARAAAARINLGRKDLPAGFTGAPPSGAAETHADNAAFAACLGTTPASRYLAEVPSASYAAGDPASGVSVSSDVTVLPAARDAAHDLAAIRGPKTDGCVRRMVLSTLDDGAGAGVQLSGPRTAAVPVRARGTDGAFGRSYRFELTGPGGSAPLTLSMLIYWKGRTQVGLTVISTRDGSSSDSFRDQLFDKLVARGRSSAV